MEPDLADDARRIMGEAAAAGCEIVLPTDVVVTREFREGAEGTVTDCRRRAGRMA